MQDTQQSRMGMAQMNKMLASQRNNLPKYVLNWVAEATAYWIFVIIMLDSAFGFNWWLIDRPYRFGWICIVYAIKNFFILVQLPFMHKKVREFYIKEEHKRFPVVDVVTYLLLLIFWIVSAIYAYDRRITSEHVMDPEWRDRYQQWTDNIYILPVVKLCVDFVLCIVATIVYPTSQTSLSGGGLIWMDLQYLFVYLFITGKVSWDNYFTVFVWIFIASIVALIGALCILCGVIAMIVKGGEKALAQVAMMSIMAVMIIIFFVWECIIGDGKNTNKDVNYMLLVCVILYTIFHASQTFIFWRGVNYFADANAAHH